jgi:hypothetical protein
MLQVFSSLVLMLLVCAPGAVKAQGGSPLVIRVEQTIRSKEPGWKYVRGIQSGRIRLVPSERTLVASSWERQLKGGGRESLYLNIYEVDSPSEAARWLRPISEGKVAAGWRVEKINIADEAYLSTFRDGRLHSISFRRGNIIVEVSGGSLSAVRRFAPYVDSAVAAS